MELLHIAYLKCRTHLQISQCGYLQWMFSLILALLIIQISHVNQIFPTVGQMKYFINTWPLYQNENEEKNIYKIQ